MKIVLSLLTLIGFAFQVNAAEVAGEIFYKHPDGHLAERAVTLDVPARGKGEVVLKGEGFEWRTRHFKSSNENGRQVFIAHFPHKHEGRRVITSLVGTYMRTSDRVLYYGDLYKGIAPHRTLDRRPGRAQHIGGFRFDHERTQP